MPLASPGFVISAEKRTPGSTLADGLSRFVKLWRVGIYDEIQEVMPVQGNASIERMCQLAQVSRAGFYRFPQEKTPVEEDNILWSPW